MDYKEKYINGLECIQEILSGAGDTIKTSILQKRLQPFFPELIEDEDERIRKALIEIFSKVGKKDWRDIPTEKIIAWLEKQKVTDEEIIFRPIAGTDIRIAAKQALEKTDIGKKVVLAFNGAYISVNGKTVEEIDSEYGAWLEKARTKSNTWKPTKEQYEALDYAYNSCPDTERGNYYEGVLGTLIDDLYRLEKQGEQKSATWSEDDEKQLRDIIELLPNLTNRHTWLKSLKDRIQSKQVWSEEDSVRLQRIIDFLWHNRKGDTDAIYQQEQDIDWLKSLKW